MRVRFKRAVRERICHAEAGMEWATGDLEARTMPAIGWADEVAASRTSMTWPGPSAATRAPPGR
jgi:hypothetical protein